MAFAPAERSGENRIALDVIRLLLLTGYRREEAQGMQRGWHHVKGGYVAFPDTKGGAQLRVIGRAATKVVTDQPIVTGIQQPPGIGVLLETIWRLT